MCVLLPGHISSRLYNCTGKKIHSLRIKFMFRKTFLMTFLIKKVKFHLPKFPPYFGKFTCFSPYFTCYNVTTTTEQFTFFNCKFDFTTAEIAISYTLKYSLSVADTVSTCMYHFLCSYFKGLESISFQFLKHARKYVAHTVQ